MPHVKLYQDLYRQHGEKREDHGHPPSPFDHQGHPGQAGHVQKEYLNVKRYLKDRGTVTRTPGCEKVKKNLNTQPGGHHQEQGHPEPDLLHEGQGQGPGGVRLDHLECHPKTS